MIEHDFIARQEESDITKDHSRRSSSSLDSIDILDELEPLNERASQNESDTRKQYDDLSSIDWIQEFARERKRKIELRQDKTLNGRTIRLVDQTHTWLIIALTGILVGVLAATIDVVSLYLGDLKEGYCTSSFYLNKSFCCWGLTEDDICESWHSWSYALGLSSNGIAYIVNYVVYCLLAALFASIASFLVSNYAPYASHSGIPELKVLLSGVVIKKFLGKLTLMVKSIGLCLAVASGLWLGKEGPLVHVAVCCGSIVLKLFPTVSGNEARKRDIYSAAAAAGMSVSFGSPIGGVLFALEQISYYFPDRSMWQSFVCAMISSVSLQFIDPFRTGRLVLYQVVFDRDWHRFELVPFIMLGIIGGLYGAYFIRLNRLILRLRSETWIASYPTSEVAILTLITAVISYPNVFTRIPQSRVLTDLLQECSQGNWLDLCTEGHLLASVLLLLTAASLGSILTAITFGAKIPAGVILPSMTVGAALGRAVGMLVQHGHRSFPNAWIFSSCISKTECVTPGVYAIVGAAAALSGVTRLTISLVVIMFELTGALTYVLPLMVATMTAKFVADMFGKQGIYESWIEVQKYPYLSKDEDSFYGARTKDTWTPLNELITIKAKDDNTIQTLQDLLQSHPHAGYPVVLSSEVPKLIGYVRSDDLRQALKANGNLSRGTSVMFGRHSTEHSDAIDLRNVLDNTPFLLGPQTSMRLVADLFQKLGLRYIFFGSKGILQGIITRNDLLSQRSTLDLWSMSRQHSSFDVDDVSLNRLYQSTRTATRN